MRDLKFRAWAKLANKMIYDDWEFTTYLLQVSTKEDGNVDKFIGYSEDCEQKYCEIMQYTGLKDKFGVEIWEDDILCVPYNDIGNIRVKFKNGMFNCCKFKLSECTVMGNIYENQSIGYKEYN